MISRRPYRFKEILTKLRRSLMFNLLGYQLTSPKNYDLYMIRNGQFFLKY